MSKEKSFIKKDYVYTPLNECNVGSMEAYHFYAIVLDAGFPHKSFKSDKFVCTLKVADPSMPLDEDGVIETSTLVLFAKKFEDLPISQRVGDIIRVHRASAGIYKGGKQFTANVFFNASWALFSPYSQKDKKKDDQAVIEEQKLPPSGAPHEEESKKKEPIPGSLRDFLPFAYFGKSFSFDKSEQKIINSYREWFLMSFAKCTMLNNKYITKLKDVPTQGAKRENGKYYDIDMQVKIAQIFKLDDYSSELRVIDDSNQIWFCQILNMKFRWLREGQFVRIRAACLEHHDKYERTFGLKNYSNILVVPYHSIQVKQMKIDQSRVAKELDRDLLCHEDQIMHPVIASQITNQKYKYLPLRSLEQILDTEAKDFESQYFRTRFSVECVLPSNEDQVTQYIAIQNKKTGEVRECSAKGGPLKKEERYVLYMQLYVQDFSNFLSNQLVRVLVCESEGTSTLFKGIKIEDVLKKKEAQEKVKQAVKNLQKFNVWVEGLVELTEDGYLLLRDTELKEY